MNYMLDGIGAKGGKKDFNQTLKNIKRAQREEQLLVEEKEKKVQRELAEKKKNTVAFSPIDLSKETEHSTNEKAVKKQSINSSPIIMENRSEVAPSKEKFTLEDSVDVERISSILKQMDSTLSAIEKRPSPSDSLPQDLDLPPTIETVENKIQEEEPLNDPDQSPQEVVIESDQQEKILQTEEQKDSISKQDILEKPSIPSEEPILSSISNSKIQEENEQEEILELKVAIELDRLLKDNRYELKRLYTELDAIQKDADDLYEVSETEQAIEEIERLLEYLEQIKRQLEVISRSHNLDLIYQLEDPYFSKLVEEYKSHVKDQQTIETHVDDFKKSEEYISLMKRILEFEQLQEDLTTTLEERKEELNDRDQDFELLQDQYLDLEKVTKDLESLIEDSQRHLEFVSKKVNEAVESTTKMQIKMKYTLGILARTLLLFSLIKMNPKPKANAATAVEAIVAVDLIRNLLKPKEEKRMVTEYHCPDYRNMIENALTDIHSVSHLIQNGLSQVQGLQKTFEAEFGKYADVLPEYKDLLASITKVEKELQERKDNMQRIENNMKHQLRRNNQKVLEYEKLNARNCA